MCDADLTSAKEVANCVMLTTVVWWCRVRWPGVCDADQTSAKEVASWVMFTIGVL